MLDELKNRLRITWDEEDDYLNKIIEQSKSYLSDLTGATFDFEKDLWEKDLLLERCRYIYNNAVDEFERNFSHELKRLIMKVALKKASDLNEQADP